MRCSSSTYILALGIFYVAMLSFKLSDVIDLIASYASVEEPSGTEEPPENDTLMVVTTGSSLGLPVIAEAPLMPVPPKALDDSAPLLEQVLASIGVRRGWQTVKRNYLYTYSAYYDPRRGTVTVIGAADAYRAGGDVTCLCGLWYSDHPRTPWLVTARVALLPEEHGKRYGTALVTCPVATKYSPDLVSLYVDPSPNVTLQSATTMLMRVTAIRESGGVFQHQFTVCTTLLQDAISPGQFVEAMELNRMFHADTFNIYHSLDETSELWPYLRHYTHLELATTPTWNLPEEIVEDIHGYGKLAALNDCVYRNMYISNYIVLTDLDEIIVPMLTESWSELLGSFDSENMTSVGSFGIQSSCFPTVGRLDKKFVKNDFVRKHRVYSLLKTIRKTTPVERNRTKMILLPERVVLTSADSVHQYVDESFRELVVSDSQAMVFHYRKFCAVRNSTDTQDRRMHAFTTEIIGRLKNVYYEVNGHR